MQTNKQKQEKIKKTKIENFQFLKEITKICYEWEDRNLNEANKNYLCMFGNNYEENHELKTLNFKLKNIDLSYDKLEKISKLLQTTKINFRSEAHHWALSEYTQGTDQILMIWCEDVKFD